MVCTFFGHRDVPSGVREVLKTLICDLIEKENADTFYVGNQGAFDYMARGVLKELKARYSHINYLVVLAYMPTAKAIFNADTLYPDGLESVPQKFAILKRNEWLIENSDTVVTYVKYSFGGANKFTDLAEKKNKWVINLAD